MKYQFTYTRNDYLTPNEFIKEVLKKYKLGCFDCDVCCSQTNIPANFYYTMDGLFDAKNLVRLSRNDGLSGSWFKNNWCNPPFNITDKFVKKALEEQKKNKNIYMLIPARTETNYWHNGILNQGKPNKENIEIVFLKKGLCFLNPETKKPIQMKRKCKDGSIKNINGIYKNGLALVVFKGYYG